MCKIKVDLYLTESYENPENESFEILDWWEIISSRYPILSYVARDILVIHVSIAASKSTFNAGGRILNPHRCSLSTRMVEALICIRSWLCSTLINLDKAIDENEHVETEKCNNLTLIVFIDY